MVATIGLALLGLGIACLAGAALALRVLGPAYRVGRLLAGTRRRSIEQAVALARAGTPAYVRLTGRLTSDEVFPDEHDRPLVYRRQRLLARHNGGWQTLSDGREAVEFGIEARTAYIALDAGSLDEGLVVIPRIAVGTVADLAPDVARGLAPETPAQLVIEQVSAVEQATVAGVATIGSNGQPVLGAGLGRPLILTTLEPAAAMRVLVAGHRRVARLATVLLGAAAVCLLAGVMALLIGAMVPAIAAVIAPAVAFAADPSPILGTPFDPRAGETASRVGDPFAAAVFVLLVGAVAAVLTVLYARLARR